MARLILKSPYLKPGGKKSPGGYLKYIATREGVEMAKDTSCHLPATAEQQKRITKLLKQYKDGKDSHEYQDYLVNPTRGNADAFISGIMELHGDAPQRDVYLKYIDERPGSNGLFTDEGVPIVLSKVQKEMNKHPGNIWTHIISLRREDAERLHYSTTDAWMHLPGFYPEYDRPANGDPGEPSDGTPHSTTRGTVSSCAYDGLLH